MTNPRPQLPAELEPLRTEMSFYFRELPRLLEEKEEGRYAVIKGETLHGVWDTFHDARQYGYLRFDDGVFLSQKIDARFLPLLEKIFGEDRPPAKGGCSASPPPAAEVA